MKRILLLSAFTCVTFFAKSQVPSYVPMSGLAAWYPFSGNAGDSSGNGNNGTVYGASLTTDRYGKPNSAYSFNGINNYIYINSSESLNITGDITISAWIKSSNYNDSTSGEQIFWHGDPAHAHDPYMIYLDSNQVLFRRDVNTGNTVNQTGFSATVLDTNKFHLIVGVYDSTAGVMAIYLDGVLDNQVVLPGNIDYSTYDFYNIIGAVDYGVTQNFLGKIDDVGAWSRVLAPCEIRKLYYSLSDLIVNSPKNDTAILGDTAIFTIRDTGVASGYQWQANYGTGFVNMGNVPPYSGVNTKTLIVSPVSTYMAGYLFRCIRLDSICSDTSTSGKLYINTTGIAQVGKGQDNVLFPNPNNGYFTIKCQLDGGQSEKVNVKIFDIFGQVVYEDVIFAQNGLIDSHFQLSNTVSSGMYFIQLRSEMENKSIRFFKD